jgi:hypothetical protein
MRNFDEEEGEDAGWRYADVDLKPMMAIVCILIPLLMFAFSFYEIKVQPVAAPKVGFAGGGGQGTQTAAPDETKVPLNLTVLMTPRGFRVKMTTEVAGANADQLIDKKSFPDKDGKMGDPEYDYPALYARLIEIKKEHGSENSINIGADVSSDIPITWDHVARAMDTARSYLTPFKDRDARPMPVAEKFQTMEEFSQAVESLDEQGKPKPLFPQVVFVVGE